MKEQGEISDNSFTSAMTLALKGGESIPERYILPPLQRPNPSLADHPSTSLPVIDLSLLNDPLRRLEAVNEIREACNKLGFFQSIYDEIDEGSQVMAVNCYPSCPKPDLVLGMPPHSDYGTLTILNQSQQGLEIMDQDRRWHSVPFIQGALIVQLGDQIEIMSNGRYKSTIHRATVNMERKRLSIASLHSLPIGKKVGPMPQLVDEQHPIAESYAIMTLPLSYTLSVLPPAIPSHAPPP